ncbi:MAG: DUF1638 domain-containing protein [Bacillota bacterium]|nr:DUF1638 domain-containing protein [Bacillota bacterium]
MSTVIISCGNLLNHLDAAQKKMKTSYDVIEVDTVLIAMGLCGGSVSDIKLPRSIVIPKVDDCITLLMHTDDIWHANLKKCGHLYLTDTVDGKLSVSSIRNNLIEKYGEKKGLRLFDMWFKGYYSVDIIDTGVYDCRSESYLSSAVNNASLINCPLTFVQGSNILLEKLVSDKWDEQFITAEKGTIIHKEDFNK